MIDERLLSPEEFASMSQVFPEGFTGRVGLMIAQAQLALCDAEWQQRIEQEALNTIKCIKDANRDHPDWNVDDVIHLLEFREETRQALKKREGV